jgi:hypothetical protein
MNTMFTFYCFLIALVSFSPTTCVVDSFTVTPVTTTTTTRSHLWMSSAPSTPPPSRRDVLKNTGSAVAAAAASMWINPNAAQAAPTAQSVANKANESFQGVYFDPNHPDGYRVLMAAKGSGTKATMTLSDGAAKGATEEPKTFRDIPVSFENDELVFDFGFKNGPTNLKAKLSPDKQSITFEDGNTWTKNYYKYDGIYKVTSGGPPSLSKDDAYRVVRKNGPEIILELNDTGNPKDSYFVDGSVGTLFAIPTCSLTFYFGGKSAASSAASEYSFMDAMYDMQRGNAPPPTNNDNGTVIGQLSILQDWNSVYPYGTLTFPDKTVWTRL